MEISKRVSELKKSIADKNMIFNKLKTEKFKPNPQNESFFKQIEDAVNLFNMKAASVQMGFVFYNDFVKRIDDLQTQIKDYVMSRDMEKKDLTDSIQSGNTSAFNMKGKLDSFGFFILILFFLYLIYLF